MTAGPHRNSAGHTTGLPLFTNPPDQFRDNRNLEQGKARVQKTERNLDYVLRAISDGKSVWVRGWAHSPDELAAWRGLTPSQIRRRRIGMRLAKR